MTEAFGLTDTGCVRTNNEDYYLLAPELGLYLLADGMGGAKAGERASQLAVNTVVEFFRQASLKDSQALWEAVHKANLEVHTAANADLSLEGMGTTLVVALDVGDEVIIASVGDSRAYLLAGESFAAVTQDQSWVNEVGRPLGLDESSLKRHPLRHVLTMAIGTGDRLVVNFYSVEWKPGALLLLSSDGLHGVVSPEEMERTMREVYSSLESKCRQLIEAARAAGAPDNVTAVILKRN